ncbi:beta-1,3-galactosyltransferase 5-like [Dreissena polymorpha]|uniref:Hexosyltransferase n=1 Tax=Dreissena polymorpha TaxID=45954 RepID=A0A9D4MX24_DREPO|nr:beta-1,3-galactosyltransferase 5-like [Dreissena polymorpha]KAH3883780.1 hypothetical protein DPMN_007748 [Dreissena polymorpha]
MRKMSRKIGVIMCVLSTAMVVFYCVTDRASLWIDKPSTKNTVDEKQRAVTSYKQNGEFGVNTKGERRKNNANIKVEIIMFKKTNGTELQYVLPDATFRTFDFHDPGQVALFQRKAIEARYYSLPKTKVNHIDHKLIITGRHICDLESPYLLIVVPSVPSHADIREVIRSTIGSFGKYRDQTVHGLNIAVPFSVKLVFVLGRNGDALTDLAVRNESHSYGDILQADFVESYYNLTRKMLVTLKWVSVYCSEIDYMLKLDEDVFVNIPVLVHYLRTFRYTTKGSIHGHINWESPVRRLGKWAVKWSEFPLTQYPNYAVGNSYVISGNIIPRMFRASEYLPYMPIEDAFVTGILGKIVEAEKVHNDGFTYWLDSKPVPCAFAASGKISATKVSSSLMKDLWNACISFQNFC